MALPIYLCLGDCSPRHFASSDARANHNLSVRWDPRSCNDPVNSCSGVNLLGDTYEYGNGRRHQTLDQSPKERLGHEIFQGKTTVAEASRAYDLTPSEIESWMEDARSGMENALRTKPLDLREQYEKEIRKLQEAYGEAMLELRARKKLESLLEDEK